jgi:hypothetical protein
MGREVRKVPADWKHPKEQKPDWSNGTMVEQYKPLFEGEKYQPSVDVWDEECAKWRAGWRDDYCTEESDRAMEYEQWAGQRPNRDDYMPNWPAEQRTHYMMYETTSEGTPISPAFATPEDLARWLADTGASSFGRDTATYEQWLNVCKGEYAPSAIFTPETGLISGVAATALWTFS